MALCWWEDPSDVARGNALDPLILHQVISTDASLGGWGLVILHQVISGDVLLEGWDAVHKG